MMRKNMSRFWLLVLLLFALSTAAIVAGCGKAQSGDGAGQTAKEQTLDEKVDAIVDSMMTTEKVGQMVMIGVQGTDVTDDSLYMLHQYHMGGVILFDRNMESADQTKKLIADLQAKADQKVPLFIGVDEEGGQVVRGKSFLTPPPSEQEIGRSGEVTRAEESARQTAEKLKKLGFNVNFAPVADVGEYARSFSADPEQAAKFVEAAAQGYEQQHMMYALKHFPGIGRGTVDSHEDISSITATKAELLKRDIVPFQKVIDERQSEDYFVLVSHLRYPALDGENPASLSKAIQTDFLASSSRMTSRWAHSRSTTASANSASRLSKPAQISCSSATSTRMRRTSTSASWTPLRTARSRWSVSTSRCAASSRQSCCTRSLER